MARIDEETKERRKERVWLEVRQNNGIRQSEIADQLNLEGRTAPFRIKQCRATKQPSAVASVRRPGLR